ncbi:MAG: YkgJ family cysteine cluster protein [Candidatus Eremiobacteraeota bacterium]|nr:YkgJ family cysteine cluster protein [Candidatus Eremiobacteraeota bacterium]
MSMSRIHQEQRYDCLSCGKGCKKPWKIKVKPERIPGIQLTSRFQQIQKEGYTPLPILNGVRQVGRREDASCVFLVDDLCAIHSELGYKAKPQICQLFPFFNVNTPGGRYYSVSFACPAVLSNQGKPVEEHLPSVDASLSEDNQAPMPPDTIVPITERSSLAWDDYLELEKQLHQCWDEENPVKALLLAAVNLVDQGDGPFNLSAEAPNQAILQEALSLYGLVTVHTMAEFEHLDKEEEGFRGLALMDAGHNYRSRLLDASMPVFSFHRPEESEQREALTRYFNNLLIGKQLIHGGTLVTRLLQLASSIGILLYYLDFQRKLEGLEKAGFEQLLWAFDLVEVRLMSHSQKYLPIYSEFERSLVQVAGI